MKKKSRKTRSSNASPWPKLPGLPNLRGKGKVAVILAVLAAIFGFWEKTKDSGTKPKRPGGGARIQSASGKVVGVHDGDTITVYPGGNEPQLKVRLGGIDAPELKQPFGGASKATLSAMVYNKKVKLKVTDEDRYGRLVATVTVDGVTNVNLAMIRAGMAWHYAAYSSDASLAEAQRDARSSRRGLWSDRSPTAPWDFRKKEG